MPVTEQDLWQLAVKARLFSAAAQARLATKFQAKRGAAPSATAQELAHWLVRKRVITSYQAKVLLAGRPGPFMYGKYLVIDRIREGRLSGLFRALHRPTRCPVLLEFLKSPPPASAAWRQAAEWAAQRRSRETRLARCYELVHKPPYAFAVLESLHGHAAASLDGAGMSAAQACTLARETALALAELHAAGETHGQVSPEDLWLDEKLGVRLLRLPTARDQGGTAAGDVHDLAELLRALLGRAEPTPELERVLQWLAPSDPQSTPTAREAAAALLPLSAPLPAPAPQRSRRRAAYLAWLEHASPSRREAVAEMSASPGAFQPPQISDEAPSITPVEFQVQQRSFTGRARVKRANSGTTLLVAALVATAGLAIVAGLLVWSLWPAESERPLVKSEVTGANKAPTLPPPAAVAPSDSGPAPDDGVSLWAPPTAGRPLDLELLASGAQLLLAVRPADLWASPEGQRLLGSAETLGFDPSSWLESATGLPVDELESVLLAVYAREAGTLDVSLVVRTRRAVSDLPGRWPGAQPSPVDSGTVYQSDGWSYFIPTQGERRFAVGSLAMIREIAAASGPPLLRRELEGLLASTDQDRQLTLLVAPAYFFSAGQGVFKGAQGLELPLRQFLGEGLSAAALSVHVPGDDLFVEMRAVGRADTRARTLAADLVARLQALPNQVQATAQSSSLSPYARELVLDLPRMLEELASYTRSDVEQGQAVLRAYLPARAAHNLSLGGALLALETGSSGGAPASAPPPAAKPLAERLGQPISLVFPRETLEAALQQWGEAAGVPISVIGADLEAESVTRNQSFGLESTNQPAGGVLRQILLLASREGKLVYVIKAAGGGEDSPSLVVTTRAAAQRRGDTIPAEFGPAR